MGDIDRMQVKTYDGTKESAMEVLESFNVDDNFYHYNFKDGSLLIHKMGLRLMPGDCYHFRLPPQPIEAI